MPVYEYYCPPCSSRFEVLRAISEMDAPAVCPDGHTTSDRVLSLFAPFAKSTRGDAALATLEAPTAVDACCAGGSCSCC